MSSFKTGGRLSGLGINLYPPDPESDGGSSTDARLNPSTVRSDTRVPSMRSVSAMQGLLLAEVGDSMVELDPSGTGFKEGQRIAQATPGGGSRRLGPNPHVESFRRALTIQEKPEENDGTCVGGHTCSPSLARHGTLLTAGAPPARNAVELMSLLGDTHAKLKSRAAVLPPPRAVPGTGAVMLEQAKRRARVALDVVLASPVCVQGSTLTGHVCIRVRAQDKGPIAVARAGKMRVVGFESIPHGGKMARFVFYQTGGRLQGCVWKDGETGDEEGFGIAKEGVHVLPFRLMIPLEGKDGDPKGPLDVHGDIAVRYIAIASIKVKEPLTGARSIAHFYRAVTIYPRLDPSLLLLPAPSPLQARTAAPLFFGGGGNRKVHLAAAIHRLHFIAGQPAGVRICIANNTRRTVREVTLELIRQTVVFRPQPHLDLGPSGRGDMETDPDACQTVTMVQVVAQSTLEMGNKSTGKHASAKGWWPGVRSGEKAAFEHFILLPAEALTVPRGRLLEVEYNIRVSLSAGSLSSDVHVVLPIRVVNFLSVDPPHEWPLEPFCFSAPKDGLVGFRSKTPTVVRGAKRVPAAEVFQQETGLRGSQLSGKSTTLETLPESGEEHRMDTGLPAQTPSPSLGIAYEDDSSGIAEFGDGSDAAYDAFDPSYDQDSREENHTGEFEDEEPDAGDASSDSYARPARFADLYYHEKGAVQDISRMGQDRNGTGMAGTAPLRESQGGMQTQPATEPPLLGQPRSRGNESGANDTGSVTEEERSPGAELAEMCPSTISELARMRIGKSPVCNADAENGEGGDNRSEKEPEGLFNRETAEAQGVTKATIVSRPRVRTVGGSAGSVKERIKELEQRALEAARDQRT